MRTEIGQARLFETADSPGKAPVRVIGVGDAGCRAASEIWRQTVRGVEIVCVDTDSASLDRSRCDRTFLLGAASMRGFGSGGDVRNVGAAATEQSDAIRSLVTDAECVVVVAGPGGGTGAGAAPVISEIAGQGQALVVFVALMPFDFEPVGNHLLAADALDRVQMRADAVLEVPQHERSLANHPGVRLSAARDADRRFAATFVATLAAIVTESPVRCDANQGDLRTVLSGGATVTFGTGYGFAHTGAVEATQKCLDEAFSGVRSRLDIDRALVLIESGPDLPVSHVATIMAKVESRLDSNSEVETAIRRSRLLGSNVRVSLIGSHRQMRRPLVAANAPLLDHAAAEELGPVAFASATAS